MREISCVPSVSLYRTENRRRLFWRDFYPFDQPMQSTGKYFLRCYTKHVLIKLKFDKKDELICFFQASGK